MDTKICLQKLQYVGVFALAAVDENGNPYVRNISAIYYEPDSMYFFYHEKKGFLQRVVF